MRTPLAALVLALAACAGSGPPVPVEEGARAGGPGPAATEAPGPARDPAAPGPGRSPAPAPASPAVVALLEQAAAAEAGGSLEGAAARVERALRIDPRNGLAWCRLAELRLRQQRLPEAEAAARKCGLYAAGDPALQRWSRELIEEAGRRRRQS